MLNSLSLFSGYGGLDLALEEYAKPIMYCEIERYAQAILLSRMDEGSLPFAPIWNDVTTLDGTKLRGMVDILSGGFPCQDISVAGNGKGLDGQRSGLFYEIARLANEAEAPFLFLENVPAIRTRGADQVQRKLSDLGYDSRWITLSASQIGANHKRERWFCLAHTSSPRLERQRKSSRVSEEHTHPNGASNTFNEVSYSDSSRLSRETFAGSEENDKRERENYGWPMSSITKRNWWEIEPRVGRVVDGHPFRVDRIKALGNGVVPLQAKTAFEILMGIKK